MHVLVPDPCYHYGLGVTWRSPLALVLILDSKPAIVPACNVSAHSHCCAILCKKCKYDANLHKHHKALRRLSTGKSVGAHGRSFAGFSIQLFAEQFMPHMQGSSHVRAQRLKYHA